MSDLTFMMGKFEARIPTDRVYSDNHLWLQADGVIALGCDISEEEVQRTKLAIDDGGWSDDDAVLLCAADELHEDARISDSTWRALAGRLTDQQLLDVIFTVGNYHLVAFALNSCGVELDPGVRAAM